MWQTQYRWVNKWLMFAWCCLWSTALADGEMDLGGKHEGEYLVREIGARDKGQEEKRE